VVLGRAALHGASHRARAQRPDTGEVTCLGWNGLCGMGTGGIEIHRGQLHGLPGAQHLTLDEGLGYVHDAQGEVTCWGPWGDEFGCEPIHLARLGPVGAIAASRDPTCAVGASGELRCWGDNTRGSRPPSVEPRGETPTGCTARGQPGGGHPVGVPRRGSGGRGRPRRGALRAGNPGEDTPRGTSPGVGWARETPTGCTARGQPGCQGVTPRLGEGDEIADTGDERADAG
jgi:hypothetical protein